MNKLHKLHKLQQIDALVQASEHVPVMTEDGDEDIEGSNREFDLRELFKAQPSWSALETALKSLSQPEKETLKRLLERAKEDPHNSQEYIDTALNPCGEPVYDDEFGN